MGVVRASSERTIGQPRQEVWDVLRDYGRRPAWLPDAFRDYSVESGGIGAGTVASYTLSAGRRERAYRVEVTEPEPDRQLRERDTNSSLVTTWTLADADGGGTRVELASEWQGASGIGGFFERTFAPKALGRVYDGVLERLERELAG